MKYFSLKIEKLYGFWIYTCKMFLFSHCLLYSALVSFPLVRLAGNKRLLREPTSEEGNRHKLGVCSLLMISAFSVDNLLRLLHLHEQKGVGAHDAPGVSCAPT